MSLLRLWLSPVEVNAEHNLFVSESKHLYLDAKGNIRSQKAPLDRRTCGKRKMLTRLVLLDVGSGALYGELHDDATAGNVGDFLLRAWHPKAGHYFRGVPRRLNLPRKLFSGAALEDLQAVTTPARIPDISQLPNGFAAGVHALRLFDEAVRDVLWRDDKIALSTVQAMSAVLSYVATASLAGEHERWDSLAPLPLEARRALMARDGEEFFRSGPFAYVIPESLGTSEALAEFTSEQLVRMRPGAT